MILVTSCPICHRYQGENLTEHIRKEHSDEEIREAVLKAKKEGMPDAQIGRVFGVTFRQLESIITEAYGINVSNLKKIAKINSWGPPNFKEETTTIWSFKRGAIGQLTAGSTEETGLRTYQEMSY